MRRRQVLLGMAVAAAGVLAACTRGRSAAGTPVAAGATVLALGDSLTFGTGATPETAYPAVLARLTGWKVLNAGVPGHTSQDALGRVDALLAEHRPALVLLGIGGNDLLRRLDEAQLEANLRELVARCRAAGAQVLLIAVPRPTLAARVTGSLDDHPLYGRLAEQLTLPLHRQGWSEVLADASLRADTIHANAAGYERFAQGLVATLRASRLFAG